MTIEPKIAPCICSGTPQSAYDALIAERDRLRDDQKDWRRGVALIASALGEIDPPNLACVRLAESVLEMRAKLEASIEWANEQIDFNFQVSGAHSGWLSRRGHFVPEWMGGPIRD